MTVCSGIGAPEFAAPWVDWRYQAEVEPFPSAVLAHRFPEATNLGDMTKFKEWPNANVDVLTGGTPCQSFSLAGLRAGLTDPRGNLMLTFLALARKYRPRWVVWENVCGVLSSSDGRDFGSFLAGLGVSGYGWAYRVLDAQYVRTPRFPHAVPQRRRRVFVVGHLGDWRPSSAVLFEPEGLQGHSPPRREAGQDVAAVTANGVGTCGEDNSRAQAEHLIASTGDVAHCLNAGGMSRQDYETETMVAHCLRGEGFDASEDGTGRGVPLIGFSKGDDGSDASFNISPTLRVGQVQAVAFSENQRHEPRESEVTAALSGRGGKPGQGYPAVREGHAVRRLTPTECERLMGFPDGWTAVPYRRKGAAECPDGPRYKALGNSWAVNCGEFVFDRIRAVEAML